MILRSLYSILYLLFISSLSTTVIAGGRRDLAGIQPLSRIRIHVATAELDGSASVKASPGLLGVHVCFLSFGFNIFVGFFVIIES